MGIRMERDSLGELAVPIGVLYGIQTQRAVENFPVSGLGPHPDFLWATILVKKAAALANMADRSAGPETGAGHRRPWPTRSSTSAGGWISSWWTASRRAPGTSHNMNANEVLANRANELLGGRRGEYEPVHPNDHVNMAQSSNDVVPAMVRLACLRGWERV